MQVNPPMQKLSSSWNHCIWHQFHSSKGQKVAETYPHYRSDHPEKCATYLGLHSEAQHCALIPSQAVPRLSTTTLLSVVTEITKLTPERERGQTLRTLPLRWTMTVSTNSAWAVRMKLLGKNRNELLWHHVQWGGQISCLKKLTFFENELWNWNTVVKIFWQSETDLREIVDRAAIQKSGFFCKWNKCGWVNLKKIMLGLGLFQTLQIQCDLVICSVQIWALDWIEWNNELHWKLLIISKVDVVCITLFWLFHEKITNKHPDQTT